MIRRIALAIHQDMHEDIMQDPQLLTEIIDDVLTIGGRIRRQQIQDDFLTLRVQIAPLQIGISREGGS